LPADSFSTGTVSPKELLPSPTEGNSDKEEEGRGGLEEEGGATGGVR